MALTTLVNVKGYLGIKDSLTEHDELLTRLIDAASVFIENWLGVSVLRHTVIEHRDGNNKPDLVLYQHPVIAVNLLKINDREIENYRVADWWIILKDTIFPCGRRNIYIEYEAGFDVVPADIEQAVIDLVSLRYKEKDRIGIQSKTLANETISYFSGDLSPASESILQRYKRVI